MLDGLFNRKEIIAFFRRMDLRIAILIAAVAVMAAGLVYRLFTLQIVNGERYLTDFHLQIKRDVSLPATRGMIYDRNGNVLAYNELTYSVTIRDLAESSSHHDEDLNRTILETVALIEKYGDQLVDGFGIALDEAAGEYVYTVSGRSLQRFLADVYGKVYIDDMDEEQKNSTAQDIMNLLAVRYGLAKWAVPDNRSAGIILTSDYDKVTLRKLIMIRYRLSLNSYQKYIATTIATNIKDTTLAAVMENRNRLEGVEITEDTLRRYNDSVYFAQIIGYTGRINSEELETLRAQNPSYTANDIVGKSGIEKSMELRLQGTKGEKTVYVDNLGKELETSNLVQPVSGNDVYLTIDRNLQVAAYRLLEKNLANIILAKLQNIKEFTPNERTTGGSWIIPIYDVYYSVIKNGVIELQHLRQDDSGDAEKRVCDIYEKYRADVLEAMHQEIYETMTPYKELSLEMRNYQTYLVQALYDGGVISRDLVDRDDPVYKQWTTEEVISMTEYLRHCITQNWIDPSGLELTAEYADADEVFEGITAFLDRIMLEDESLQRMYFRFMLQSDCVDPADICLVLIEQGKVSVPQAERAALMDGLETPYTFMENRLRNLDLTPAQLNLDPYSGSMVITDVNTGEIRAMVSYPSFDNNYMANTVDPVYYEKLRNDLSRPLINYATQQRTAPGSTFKMVVSTAGLMEGVINPYEEIFCGGDFDKIGVPYPRCWIYPDGHGSLNLPEGITNSCNDYFYEVGFRLGTVTRTEEDGRTSVRYDSQTGIEKLKKYAELYGFGAKSGAEIEEESPQISTQDAVRSSIGQGNSNYTTVGLSRYITTVANSGTCFDLTLVSRILDADGIEISTGGSRIRNVINMDDYCWDAIHQGMRGVAQSKLYFYDLPVEIAGKTGTAQEAENRPNHALFLCYAPYDDPQISVATRIANGYSSDYAARVTNEVLKYYFGSKSLDELLFQQENPMLTHRNTIQEED